MAKTSKRAAKANEPEVLGGDGAVATAEPEAKTLGDHVAEAKDRPQKIAWTHDVGSSVLLLTDGHPPKRAIIRNIHDHGSYAYYDLLHENGGVTENVEAWRIGRDLDAEGELARARERMARLEKHAATGKALAVRHAEMEAEEKRLADVLSNHRRDMHAVASKLAAHVRSDPMQMDLSEAIAAGGAEPAAEQPADESTAAVVKRRIAAGDVIELAEFGISFDELRAARLDRDTASTGKPPQVKPVSVGVEEHVLVDVQDGVAVLAPLVDKKAWDALYADTYGPRKELPDADDLTGSPVRVGRTTLYLCPVGTWLLAKVPAELAAAGAAEPARSGKDAAAGD